MAGSIINNDPSLQLAPLVTNFQQYMQTGQAGQVQQQNALSMQNQQKAQGNQNALRSALSQGNQNALRSALSQGINGMPQDQQNALSGPAQSAPTEVDAYPQQVGQVTAENADHFAAKSQAVAQQLGQLVAIPDGPQRESAYQQFLDQEQQQGLDVSQMRNLPANAGIRMAFARVQDVQSQIEAMQPSEPLQLRQLPPPQPPPAPAPALPAPTALPAPPAPSHYGSSYGNGA